MKRRTWKTFELKPLYDEDRKSYYKKAYVHIDQDGNYYLQSYNTMVCGFTNMGEFERYWGGYSATTMKHIKEFIFQWNMHNSDCIRCAFMCADAMNKKLWDSLPLY